MGISLFLALFSAAWHIHAAPSPVHSFDAPLAEGKSFVVAGQTMYFMLQSDGNGPSLWRTDGTDAGTVLLAQFYSPANYVTYTEMVPVGDTVLFTADDGVHGTELWRSDGTVAGTAMVKDIYLGSGSSGPSGFVVMNNTVYFAAADPDHGCELWSSDGTAAGTHLVADINPGPNSSLANFELTNADGTLYFIANDGQHGAELWRSDGTAAGTMMVTDLNPGPAGGLDGSGNIYGNPRFDPMLTALGQKLYFQASPDDVSVMLYRTDGTAAGTQPVPGPSPTVPFLQTTSLCAWGNKIFMGAYDGNLSVCLMTFDPATSQSSVIQSFSTANGYVLNGLTVANGKLYFTADDGTHGGEPWSSDGTAAGTQMLGDLCPYSTSNGLQTYPSSSYAQSFTGVPSGVYFIASAQGETGSLHGDVWMTDGTAADTQLATSLSSGSSEPGISAMTSVNDGIYFFTTNTTPPQLWRIGGNPLPPTHITQSRSASLSASTTTFSPAGGLGAIQVTAASDVRWNATATVPWITLLTPAPGAGSGSLRFSVQPSPDSVPRSGLITIADRVIVVTQHGSISGTYCGLLNSPASDVANYGRITLTVTESGSFTGSLTFGTAMEPFAGHFTNGTTTVLVKRAGQPDMNLNLNVASLDGFATVGLTTNRGGGFYGANAGRVLRAKNHTMPGRLPGRYTCTLSQPSDATLPQGNGWLTGTLGAQGNFTYHGRMGDGTPILGACRLLENSTALVYAHPYGPAGLVSGALSFTPASSSTIAGTIDWNKPAGSGAHPTSGFVTLVSLTGESYHPETRPVIAFGTAGNTATLSFPGAAPAGVPASVALTFTPDGTINSSDPRVTMVLNRKAGSFAGVVRMPAPSAPLRFSGALLQPGATGAGTILSAEGASAVAIAAASH